MCEPIKTRLGGASVNNGRSFSSGNSFELSGQCPADVFCEQALRATQQQVIDGMRRISSKSLYQV